MWSRLNRKELTMKLTRIAAVIALAATMSAAFGATSGTEQATDQTPAATTQHQWYQAGDRELQSKQAEQSGAQGFPAPGQIGADY
jgi:outer membrane protein assembly factor BamD (BamD/ComL family)